MKIPMPNFRRPQKTRPHKLDAAARRAPARSQDEYNEEPTMRLSSALVIVFILHLIAGGGLWAFSNFKEKHGEEAVQRDVRERLQTASADPAGPAPGPVPTGLAPKPAAMVSSVAKPAADAGPMPKDSGEIYVVKKGDNPVKIAKRQNVSYDDLMRLNQLDDARYLQIGQKLRLPARRHEAKTEHE